LPHVLRERVQPDALGRIEEAEQADGRVHQEASGLLGAVLAATLQEQAHEAIGEGEVVREAPDGFARGLGHDGAVAERERLDDVVERRLGESQAEAVRGLDRVARVDEHREALAVVGRVERVVAEHGGVRERGLGGRLRRCGRAGGGEQGASGE
jgi:hypothetical protein